MVVLINIGGFSSNAALNVPFMPLENARELLAL
jgi:hypothetical protein